MSGQTDYDIAVAGARAAHDMERARVLFPVTFIADVWEIVEDRNVGSVFLDPDLMLWYGFRDQSAAKVTVQRVQAIWETAQTRPWGLFMPFLTAAEGWGFFDRVGELHATFPSEGAAWEASDKKRSVTA